LLLDKYMVCVVETDCCEKMLVLSFLTSFLDEIKGCG